MFKYVVNTLMIFGVFIITVMQYELDSFFSRRYEKIVVLIDGHSILKTEHSMGTWAFKPHRDCIRIPLPNIMFKILDEEKRLII